MKGLSVFFKDFGSMVRKPKVIIPVIAVLFIPLMYSGIFLGTFWDPYSKLSDLPVAVVNMDKGAEYEGKSLHVGDDLIDKLKENKEFGWSFVSKSEAEDGLQNEKYYLTITIPEDFSKQATTLMDDQPKPAEIVVESNEGHNFLAAQIGGTGMKTLKSEVSGEVTKAYTETVFEQLTKISDGLNTAGDGASKLNEGAGEAESGAVKLKENLAKMASGSAELEKGLRTLGNGAAALHKGSLDLKNGTTELSGGLKQLNTAHKQLETGAVQAQQGTEQLEQGIKASAEGSAKLAAGTQGLEEAIEQYMKADPTAEKNPVMQKLLATTKALAKGSADLNQGQQKLVQGVSQLKAGQDQLSGGLTLFGNKFSDAVAGSEKLGAGAAQLADGTAKLQDGLGKASKGLNGIVDGSHKLTDGAGKLSSGLLKLKDGSGELATKLNEASEESSKVHGTDERIDMFAKPVQLVENSINKVPNYGTGFSPYFLSLGLFVGALISTIVVPLRASSVEDASGWSRFVSKTLLFTVIGVLQALLADAILLYGLGLEVKSVPLFVLFSIVTSLTYMFIIQSLVTVFGNPGRFAAIVMLILQLTTCGGTFPVELTPDAFQAMGKWLPMTYTVSGYKAVISIGDFGMMWNKVGILAIYAIIFLALTFAFFMATSGKKLESVQVQD